MDRFKCIFTEVHVVDFDHCDVVSVELNKNNIINVVQYNPSPIAKNKSIPITTAVEMICTLKFPTKESLGDLLATAGRFALVRVVFLLIEDSGKLADIGTNEEDDDEAPCTSRQAREREERKRQRREQLERRLIRKIKAERCICDKSDKIIFNIDDGPSKTVRIEKFYEMFFYSVQVDHKILLSLQSACKGDWLQLFQNNKFVTKLDENNPFNKFAKLLRSGHSKDPIFLGKLTRNCLQAAEFWNETTRKCLLNVFKHVHEIFEFICYYEYTIYFYIQCQNQLKCITNLTTDDLDFSEIEIYIELKTAENSSAQQYLWNDTDHNIKDMVFIAFQLSLAWHCQQKLVILRNMRSLHEYQCLKMGIAAALEKAYEGTGLECNYHNYLQRIVDVCKCLQLVTFIEYPGGIVCDLNCANIIKCQKIDNDFWQINCEGNRYTQGSEGDKRQ